MDTETIYLQMEQDFEDLAQEHEVAASNEHLWSLGSEDSYTATMHEENAENHRLLARMYRKMKEDILAFIETYEDEED
jgi:hypothetical protein